jgi:hypothetical protein
MTAFAQILASPLLERPLLLWTFYYGGLRIFLSVVVHAVVQEACGCACGCALPLT